MPIDAPAVLTYEVQSVAIFSDGGCQVTMSISQGLTPIKTVTVPLEAAACAPVWGGMPVPGMRRWPDLKDQLYGLLQAQGAIPMPANPA
jgi:hypothetical protein